MLHQTLLSSKAIIGYNESQLAKGEANDCVVRAIAVAFDTPYDDAHKWVKRYFSRENRKGTKKFHLIMAGKVRAFGKNITQIGDTVVEKSESSPEVKRPFTYYGNSTEKLIERGRGFKSVDIYDRNGKEIQKVRRNMTVKTFLESYKEGTFIVSVTKHAFAIKDGVVIGNADDGVKLKRRIQSAFKID